ncbi:5836_t:CDS:2 [Funneliformis caledonium]|uniref:5836_t:CDS:1 n=1 Tax=Funneliformis caledonium TaxID=1117310 RepID=A0A9N9FWZ6_9GLOM|nr:5836_t:CDS:2 [Funneliformis caledonium]
MTTFKRIDELNFAKERFKKAVENLRQFKEEQGKRLAELWRSGEESYAERDFLIEEKKALEATVAKWEDQLIYFTKSKRRSILQWISPYKCHPDVSLSSHGDEIGNNGKTRLLEELKNLVQERAINDADNRVQEIFANTMAVVITFDNGSAASDNDIKLEEEIALCLQILYCYFVEGNSDMQYEYFVKECIILGLQKGDLMLGTVLKTITMDKYDQQQQNGKTTAFLLYVDETNKLIDLDEMTFCTAVNAVS